MDETSSIGVEAEVMSSIDEKVLYPEEVAKLLRVHPNSVYAMLKDGSLPAVKAGRRWLISKRRLNAWLDGGAEE